MISIFKAWILGALLILGCNPAIGQLLTDEEVAAKISALREGIDSRTSEERAGDDRVRERYADAIVIDMLVPGTPEGYVEGTIADYEAMAELSCKTGFTHVSYTAAVDDTFEVLQILQ